MNRVQKNNVSFCALVLGMLFAFALFVTPAEASMFLKPPNNLGLVGAWTFNDGAGTVATDTSSKNQAGTLTGNPTWVSGRRDKALRFDGAGDYVQVTDSANVLNPSSFTVSFWVKPNALSESDIVEKGGPGGYVFWMAASQGNKLFFGMEGGGFSDYVTGVSMPSTSAWTHVVGTYDGTTLRMYYNGSEVGNKVSGSSISNTDPLKIGSGNDGDFNGDVDEVRIYNRALSATEVATLYAQTSIARIKSSLTKTVVNASKNYSQTVGLIGLWSFDGKDLVGTTAYDRSGQGNNGTLTNGPTATIGKMGQALKFDGVDDYVTMGAVFDFTSAPFSVSYWIKLNSFSTNIVGQGPVPFFKGEYNVAGYYQQIQQNGSVTFATNQGGSQSTATAAGVITTGTWYHIVTARSGSSARIYVNGVDMTSSAATHSDPASSSDPFLLGRYLSGHSTYINSIDGAIDDVRIYNRALSAAEVLKLYNMGK